MKLTPDQCRVLGVLIEKAQTTPAQYPLTLNSIVVGCNQKSNRSPVTDLSEDQVIEALDALRAAGFVREAMLSGSRVEKYRHVARDVLSVSTSELVVLAELLLRGPQTSGELRGRASRMHPLESLEVVENLLESLAGREPPLVRRLSPAPGSRAPRFAQLLCPDLHPLDDGAPAAEARGLEVRRPAPGAELTARVERLEREVAAVRRSLETIAAALGERVELPSAPD